MAIIEFMHLREIDFDTMKPEDGPRLALALKEAQEKYNEMLAFLKSKFPGEV